jgi:amidase
VAQLWELAAWDLARRVRRREVSAREVIESHLARIEVVNPRVNAVTVALAESALDSADAADRATRTGAEVGALCGIPLTVKENIDVAGSATTLGIMALRDAIPHADAPHIGELRSAGSIPLARTNMPEFGMRWHTDNALRGATRNPWSAGHTPGGSSGGDAVAVATGMAPLGMGNDGAGSLRWPAQCCGVAALKPSLGRIGAASRFEPALPTPFAFQLLATHGPIAREVRDLELAFAHMCGRSGGDPWHAPVPLHGPPLPPPVRVSLVANAADPADRGVLAGAALSPGVELALRRAAELLSDAGYVVEAGQPPLLARASEIFIQVMSKYGRLREVQPPVEHVASANFAKFWEAFDPIWASAAGQPAFEPMMERATIARAWHDWMERSPLVLAPICTRPAFAVGADLDPAWLTGWPASTRMAVAVNLLGLPAVAVPVVETDGLPHAVQIIGPRFREDLCLSAAAVIEAGATCRTPIDPR